MCQSSRTSRTLVCALIRAAVVVAGAFAALAWTGDVFAGCGDYIHFRGSPQMAVNPVARIQRNTHLPSGENHGPGQAPGGCQGPNCSRPQVPTLPIPLKIILTHVQDCVLASFSISTAPPLAVRLIEDDSTLPRQYALGIFRPPRRA